MEKLDRIDTRKVPDGMCRHGAVDFWDDETTTVEAEETKLEAFVTWLVCLVLIGVAAYAMTL